MIAIFKIEMIFFSLMIVLNMIGSLIILIQMNNSLLNESPCIAKISQSSLHFKQLINSLRSQHRPQKSQTLSQIRPIQSKTIIENKSQGSSLPVQKLQLHSTSHLTVNQQDLMLRRIPKKLISGRDTLKSHAFEIDNNPQQLPVLTIAKETTKQACIQVVQPISQPSSTIFSPKKDATTQCQKAYTAQIQPVFQKPIKSDQKSGHIKRQNISSQKITQPLNPNNKKIRDISDSVIQQHIRKQQKLTDKSQPSEIFNFFINLCLSCNIIIKSPAIKKYKNCVYFGYPISEYQIHQGFLYFYDGKIYYGQFIDGLKHGLGTQISFNQTLKFKGQFKEGHKTGKFYVEKPNQKYIGFLQNGLYQGEGRLTTEDYVYQGQFQKGQKHGYGQQFYPKTGVKLAGNFFKGVLSNNKGSKSIPEIRSKQKILITKEKQKQRLEMVKRRSVQKHSSRMNKIRDRQMQESQYEIQLEPQQNYISYPKIHVNVSKLSMYRQPTQKLPKLCHQFDYSLDTGKNFESIQSHNTTHYDFPQSFQRNHIPHLNGMTYTQRNVSSFSPNRIPTNQLEEPLPVPCLGFRK